MKIGIASPINVKSLQDFLDIEADSPYLSLGLGATAVNTIILGLLQQGHRVSVYTLDPKVEEVLILQGELLTIYIGHYRRGDAFKRASNFFKPEVAQLKSFILQDKPDIVNAHWSYEFAIAAIQSKIPHLITFRDEAWEILKYHKDIYRLFRFLMDRWVRWNGKNFSANSPYLAEKLKSLKNLTMIPNPIDDGYIVEQEKILEKPIKIVSILTGWIERKNPKNALLAFKKLRETYKEDIELYMYGQGFGKGKQAETWAIENQCAEGVHFIGTVLHTDLMQQLKSYHILLHPALEESFGNTLLEGMALGLPVVAGKESGAVPWVLNYGKNGVLVDVRRVEDMVRGIQCLIEDENLYQRLSVDGLTYVKANFSSVSIAQKYYQLYGEILSKTHRKT
jgi:glycosyltransferase involved in cell wall biosynthesis